jgi:hypothetical protein
MERNRQEGIMEGRLTKDMKAAICKKVVTAKYGTQFINAYYAYKQAAESFLHVKLASNYRILGDAVRCGCGEIVKHEMLTLRISVDKYLGLKCANNPFIVDPKGTLESTAAGLWRKGTDIENVPYGGYTYTLSENEGKEVRNASSVLQGLQEEINLFYKAISEAVAAFSTARALLKALPELEPFLADTGIQSMLPVPVEQIQRLRGILKDMIQA